MFLIKVIVFIIFKKYNSFPHSSRKLIIYYLLIFKEEIAKRIERGYSPVVQYLLYEVYLDYFNEE